MSILWKLIEFWYHSVYDLEIVKIEARSSFQSVKMSKIYMTVNTGNGKNWQRCKN